jgi:hypothetical protein
MRRALGFLGLALIGLTLARCYRPDPLYCDKGTRCDDPTLTCNLLTRECERPGADMAAPDLRVEVDLREEPRDLRMEDLRPEPTCASHTECAMANPALPACVASKCQPCTRNFQCPNSACDEDGRCHDPRKIIEVDNRAKCRGTGGAGGAADPYCYVREAVQDPGLGGTKDVILLRTGTRLDGAFIEIGRSVRLVGARTSATQDRVIISEPLRILAQGAGTDLTIGIEDLQIANLNIADSGNASGISCTRGFMQGAVHLSVRWTRVDGVPAWGLAADNCSTVRVVSSQFTNNGTAATDSGGGLRLSGGEISLLNNFVTNNVVGIDIRTVTLFSIAAFNTFAGNQCQGNAGCNARCPAGTSYNLSYSIMLGATAEEAIRNCGLVNSYVPANYDNGATNLKNLALKFTDPARGDYHLDPSHAMNKLLRKDEPAGDARINYDIDDEPRLGKGGVIVGADQIPLP